MLKSTKQWTGLQILAFVLLIGIFWIFNFLVKTEVILMDSSKTIYIMCAVLYVFISWLYITIWIQFKKKPNMVESKNWDRFSIVLFIIALISFIAVLFGPIFEWLEVWTGFLYMLMLYFFALFFLFVLSFVHKMVMNKEKVIHITYIICSLALLIGVFVL